MSLDKMNVGDVGIVEKIETTSTIKRRLLDIGLIEGTKIECALKSPFGNPLAYLIRGALIAIRKEDCNKIMVRLL